MISKSMNLSLFHNNLIKIHKKPHKYKFKMNKSHSKNELLSYHHVLVNIENNKKPN